jgi:phenylalanine-4-hydroxylase
MGYRLEVDGWCDCGEDYYDPGFKQLELWEDTGNKSTCVWHSLCVDGDDLEGTRDIRSEFLQIMPKFGLKVEDLLDFDSDCLYDWEIRPTT